MDGELKRGIFRRKSIEALTAERSGGEKGLKRVLAPSGLVSLGIGGIIGAGIFVLTGQAAAQYAGPAIVLSFIVSGMVCVFAGLCYAELASMIPVAGSAYTYSYATLGELFAWIIGWDLILEYLFGAATVAVGWSGYVVSFLRDYGLVVPAYLSSAPLVHDPQLGWQLTGALINLPAVLIVGAVTTLLTIGIRESSIFNNAIVVLKLSVLLLFIGFGIYYIDPANWRPFIPDNTGEFGYFGWSGVLRGAGVVFFAYIGFDAVSTAAQEAKNPQKDMPIGILGSLAIATVLYVIVAAVLTGMVSYKELNVPDPIAVGIDRAGEGMLWLKSLVKIGAIAGLSSVILVLLLGQSRVFFSMASDGLLPERFSAVHRVFRTPYLTTIVSGAAAMLVAGLFPIGLLGELVSIGTLLAFVIVCVGVVALRYRHPEIPRAFRTPFVPLVPALGAAIALLQMLALPFDTIMRLIVWMVVGLLVYFLYGRRHSKA
ncbi:putative amino acid permease YhdG [uncultured bacterium]|nr:putative amino acid permease YhdG [uncultured bacterium]